LAYVIWPLLYVARVGDNRCYLFRNGELKPLTPSGHTDDGQVLSDRVELLLDDTILLCTDSLIGHLSEEHVAKPLAADGDAREISGRLVQAAMSAGGKGDVTVVVARFPDVTAGEVTVHGPPESPLAARK
jgi:serine/threonine protein phosphatase PrpC